MRVMSIVMLIDITKVHVTEKMVIHASHLCRTKIEFMKWDKVTLMG